MRRNIINNRALRILIPILTAVITAILIVSCFPMLELGYSNNDNPSLSPTTEPSQVDGEEEDKYFNLPRPITNTKGLHITGNPPEEVDIEAYRLHIEGLVDSPQSLTYKDILAYPAVTEVVLLICPGVFQDNAEWTGVPVWVILQEVGVKPEAEKVVFKAMKSTPSSSSYSATLPLEEIIENDSIFLAHTVNGQILPLEHGYPIRLVAKDRFGSVWVKWVEMIEIR